MEMSGFNIGCNYREICKQKLRVSDLCKSDIQNCGLVYGIFKVTREADHKGLIPRSLKRLSEEIEDEALKIYQKKRRFGLGQMIERKIKQFLMSPDSDFREVDKEVRSKIKNILGLRPDIIIGNKEPHTVIELFNWWDSNKFRSAMMQGYMLKKEFPTVKYFVVIFNILPTDELTKSEKIHLEWAKEEGFIDEVYGFTELPKLLVQLSASKKRSR